MTTLSEEDHAYTRMISVMAWMFFPRDEAKRHSYEDAFLGAAANSLLNRGFHNSLTADEALPLFDLARHAPAFDGLKTEALRVIRRNRTKAEPRPRSIAAGSIVANALLIPLICNLKYSRKDVGLHQAFRAMLGTGEKDDPRGLRNLQKIWKHYEPVSHFWAAWEMFGYPSMDDLDNFTAFVSLSELIRAWGERYTPRRAKHPMLNGNIVVRAPDDWVRPLEFDLILRDLNLDPQSNAFLFDLSDG